MGGVMASSGVIGKLQMEIFHMPLAMGSSSDN